MRNFELGPNMLHARMESMVDRSHKSLVRMKPLLDNGSYTEQPAMTSNKRYTTDSPSNHRCTFIIKIVRVTSLSI